MSLVWKVDEMAVWDLSSHGRAQQIKATQLSRDLWWRPLRTDGRLVLVADHDESAGLQVLEVLGDGLGEDKVHDLGLALDVGLALGTVVGVDEHADGDVVCLFPLADVVELLLVALDGLVC